LSLQEFLKDGFVIGYLLFVSYRLGLQWRVIYRVIPKELLIQVASITDHDYRRS